jgi:DNA (cytosine-5)-methyltransferase 1
MPKVFVMENVSGMVKGKMEIKFAEILSALKQSGYVVKAKLMNTVNYDVPQIRERLIFIGVRNDLGIEPSFPIPHCKQISIREAFQGLHEYTDKELLPWMVEAVKHMHPLDNTQHVKRIFAQFQDGKTYGYINTRILDWDKPCCTICKTETPTVGLIHPNKHRYLNISELKRVASFPDDFIFLDRKSAIERIGNAVMPKFMQAIATHIKENILSKIKPNAE